MKRLAVEESHLTLRQASRLAKKGVVVLTEKGKPVTALVHVGDDLAVEALALSRNRAFMAYLDACAKRASQEGGGAPIEEVRKEFGLLKRKPGRGARSRAVFAGRSR